MHPRGSTVFDLHARLSVKEGANIVPVGAGLKPRECDGFTGGMI